MPKQETDCPEVQPELIADYACEIGENPLWHPIEQCLYWTDIPTGRLFRFDPATRKHEQCYQGRPVGGFTVQADGTLLLFMDRGTIARWRAGVLNELVAEIAEERATRFNDVIADPRGRVFCGTMSTAERPGRLYRLDLDGTLHLLLENVGCSNGMAFTPDKQGFYHTDSFAREICQYDYNIENGAISNRRVFARFTEQDGFPDGASLDAEGYLWSALWDGGRLVRLRPDGTVDRTIKFPTGKTSSLTFGGVGYFDIYVTTAGGNCKSQDDPLAGGLFRVSGQTPGLPEFFSRIEFPH